MCIVRLKKKSVCMCSNKFLFLIPIMLDNVCVLGIGLAELRGEGLVRAGLVGRRQIGLLDVGVGD
jgi:hypothetical protein